MVPLNPRKTQRHRLTRLGGPRTHEEAAYPLLECGSQAISVHAGQHLAHVYEDDASLVDALANFVQTGLAEGAGVVVFATAAHWGECARRLAADGIAVHEAEGRGQLAVLDARNVLASFMVEGMPDWKAFQDVVGTVINRTRRMHDHVLAFGEMGSLLRQRGDYAAALRLEELWGHLVKFQDLALCCAYRIYDFDEAAERTPLEAHA